MEAANLLRAMDGVQDDDQQLLLRSRPSQLSSRSIDSDSSFNPSPTSDTHHQNSSHIGLLPQKETSTYNGDGGDQEDGHDGGEAQGLRIQNVKHHKPVSSGQDLSSEGGTPLDCDLSEYSLRPGSCSTQRWRVVGNANEEDVSYSQYSRSPQSTLYSPASADHLV